MIFGADSGSRKSGINPLAGGAGLFNQGIDLGDVVTAKMHIGISSLGEFGFEVFKNKIDLLYDLDILSKEEHKNLEVFMFFRNKFLHDLECSTFKIALKTTDSGIKNHLCKYLNEKISEPSEIQLEDAYFNLFMTCFKMLVSKYRKRREKIEQIGLLLQGVIENYSMLQSATHNACVSILKTLEDSELENPIILKLSELIGDECIELGKNAKDSFSDFEKNANVFKEIFGSLNLGKIKHDS